MLYYKTVNNLLKEGLLQLMAAKEFKNFRLVGGTSLSLQIGHRESIDIDLFSDVEYGKIDFVAIENYLETNFKYIHHLSNIIPGMGKSYLIGEDKDNTLKLDIFYTDKFIQPIYLEDTIRMATIEEIINGKTNPKSVVISNTITTAVIGVRATAQKKAPIPAKAKTIGWSIPNINSDSQLPIK